MDAFFQYLYEFLRRIIDSFWEIIIAIKNALLTLLDLKFFMNLFDSYKGDLSVGGWVAAIACHILVWILFILMIYLNYRGLSILFRRKVPIIQYERMKDEIVTLKREVMKANYDKDKILAMKISELGMEKSKDFLLSEQIDLEDVDKEQSQSADEGLAATSEQAQSDGITDEEDDKELFDTKDLRFPRLSEIDIKYLAKDYQQPEYLHNYSLEELCINFRLFAASRLGLYYELDVIKQAFASIGATKMLILQGISGTGKTSLPYAIGQYIQNASLICSVQPSWRDRTELVGYYNDFTKRYSETDFLKTIYEAQYQKDLRLIILDEMNIARVEYYFAEMLSILELPRKEERFISVVSNSTKSDPKRMDDGKVWIPDNVFYIGTINNDDSTFAVADKVYDRAIPIDLDDRARVFEAPDTEPMRIDYEYLEQLFTKGREKYPISPENLVELDKLDQYLIEHFRLTFGNRILRQMKAFVPCYVACGGTEIDGIDFMFQKKILRKFESLGLGFIRDEIDGLIKYLEVVYGKDTMNMSKRYLQRLKKMSGA